jgi:hypothetical protein
MRRIPGRYWNWLGATLHLTIGGRVMFTLIAALGLLGVIGDDTTGGVDGPNLAAVLAFYVVLVLLAVVAIDSAFRFVRSVTRRA